jgi:putative transposase
VVVWLVKTRNYSTDLSDAHWKLVRPLVEKRMGRPPKVSRRRILDAIFYILRTGCQWRLLPSNFPHWSTVHSAYRRWRLDGALEKLHEALREKVRLKAGRSGEAHAAILDSQSVKTTEKGGRAATTRPRT